MNSDSSIGNLGRNIKYPFNKYNNYSVSPSNKNNNNISQEPKNNSCLTNQNYIQNNKGYICSSNDFYNNNKLHYNNKYIDQSNDINERREIDAKDVTTKNITYQRLYKDDIDNYKKQITIQDRVTRVNIDSRNRTISPINTYDTQIYELKNAISLTIDSNIMTIQHLNHPFRREDKISLNNVQNEIITLKNPIEITKNSNFIKIKQKHNFFEGYDKYNTIHVIISGVKGNTLDYNFINEQIPITLINKTHQVFFKKSETDDIDPNFYYIKIPITPLENYQDGTNFDNIIKTQFLNINSVPTNLINADYPINLNRRQGFHIITDVTSNSYNILLKTQAVLSGEKLGGNQIIVRKIIDTSQGFPSPNNYIISLPRTFRNITKIQLVSSEFPNTIPQIVTLQESSPNNKLYWQNAEDGDFLYSIEADVGSYDTTSLIKHLENKISQVPRINLPTSFHQANISINESTNIVSIKLFKKNILVKALAVENNPDNKYQPIIRINHPNHFLQVGDVIIISNALGTNKISADVINTEHIVNSVINKDTYTIILPSTNLFDNITNTLGGVNINILSPLHFRMFFDREDTLGNILGFRNVGQINSITSFVTEVRNNIPYENNIPENSVGNIPATRTNIFIQNSVVNFNRVPYFNIQSTISENSLTTNNITNVLAKILTDGEKNKVLYNTFITLERDFERPISELNELEFTFLTPDGDLVEFLDIDHSFTIEIIEKTSNPTRFSTITGLIN